MSFYPPYSYPLSWIRMGRIKVNRIKFDAEQTDRIRQIRGSEAVRVRVRVI